MRAPIGGGLDRALDRLPVLLQDILGPQTGNCRLVISHEPISVGALEAWDGTGVSPEQLSERLSEVAVRLAPSATVQIVVGVRRQDEWLGSRFAESCRGKLAYLGQDHLDQVVTNVLNGSSPADLSGSLALLDYMRFLEALKESFGARNVHFLPVELLATDMYRYARMLSRALDRRTSGRLVRKLMRAQNDASRNTLRVGSGAWSRRDGAGKIRLDRDAAGAIRSLFESQNRAFSRAIGVNLGSLGYY